VRVIRLLYQLSRGAALHLRKSQGLFLVLKANNKRGFINHCKTGHISISLLLHRNERFKSHIALERGIVTISTKAIKIDNNLIRQDGDERLYYIRLMYKNSTEANNAFGREFSRMVVDGNAVGNNDALTIISGYEVLFREKVNISNGLGEGSVSVPAIQMVMRFNEPSRLEEVLDSGNLVMGQHKHIEKGIIKFGTNTIPEETATYVHNEITIIIDGISGGDKEAFSYIEKVSAAVGYGNQKYYNGMILGPAEKIITLYEFLQCNRNINRSELMIRFE
jgi:hypothetical protein